MQMDTGLRPLATHPAAQPVWQTHWLETGQMTATDPATRTEPCPTTRLQERRPANLVPASFDRQRLRSASRPGRLNSRCSPEPPPKSNQTRLARKNSAPRSLRYSKACRLTNPNPAANTILPLSPPPARSTTDTAPDGWALARPPADNSHSWYRLVHSPTRETKARLRMPKHSVSEEVSRGRKLASAEARAGLPQQSEYATPPHTFRKSGVAGSFRNRTFHILRAWNISYKNTPLGWHLGAFRCYSLMSFADAKVPPASFDDRH